jgi:hypothetical protein
MSRKLSNNFLNEPIMSRKLSNNFLNEPINYNFPAFLSRIIYSQARIESAKIVQVTFLSA